MRTLTLAGSLFAFLLEPLAAANGGEENLIHYGITQGGLLAVVLVLIYLRQQDIKQQREDNEKRHEDNLSKISILTDIAARSAAAGETSASAGRENASAIQRLAAAVERLGK